MNKTYIPVTVGQRVTTTIGRKVLAGTVLEVRAARCGLATGAQSVRVIWDGIQWPEHISNGDLTAA